MLYIFGDIYMYIYIYIYMERERERERGHFKKVYKATSS